MKRTILTLLTLIPALALFSCGRANPPANPQATGKGQKELCETPPQEDPFDITFVKTARFAEGQQGFDPQLPGYHLTGDIAAIRLQLKSSRLPESLVLAIRTSPGMRPNLESFILRGKDKAINTALSNGTGLENIADPKKVWEPLDKVKAGTYFRFAVVGDEVRVTFQPKAMEMLTDECEVSWVDWFRQ